MKAIPYGRHSITDDDIASVTAVLKGDNLTQGPAIPEFEHLLCEYTGSSYAVVFNSGTAALHAAYFALGLTSNDEFITTPLTFAATANAGLYLGARPVFVDIDSRTGNIDVTKIEKKITSKTKLLSVVHYAGNPVDLRQIRQIAKRHNLMVVDDACHALGAKYENRMIGAQALSDATILSFHPVKHITTGEGGAVLCHSRDIYEKLSQFRSHGITKTEENFINTSDGPWYHEMQLLGFNYRMTDIQASLGSSQIKKLPEFIEKRREIASIYHTAFDVSEVIDMPLPLPNGQHAYHLFPILLKPKYASFRKQVFTELREAGIGVQVHYIPVTDHPYYATLGYSSSDTPLARSFYEREISIPMYPSLSQDEIEYIIRSVLTACEHVQ